MKKLLSILLVLAMLMGMLPVLAAAAPASRAASILAMTKRCMVELQTCDNPPPRFARHPPNRGDEPRAPFQGAADEGGWGLYQN